MSKESLKPDSNKGFDLKSIKKVIKFYYQLVKYDSFYSALIIFVGLCTRVLTLVVFMLLLKVFLSVVNPTATLELVNNVLLNFTDYKLNAELMLKIMLGILITLILIQLLISKWHLKLFLMRRKMLINYALASKLNSNDKMHLNLCFDHLPKGYDGILKCCEILLFYSILFVVIFLISPFVAFLATVVVPLLVVLLVMRNRKEVHIASEANHCRKNISSMDSDLNSALVSSNKQFGYVRTSAIHSEFFGALALVIMMVVIFLNFDDQSLSPFSALGLAFAIRFSIQYARELSLHTGRILQQRVVIDKITKPLFL